MTETHIRDAFRKTMARRQERQATDVEPVEPRRRPVPMRIQRDAALRLCTELMARLGFVVEKWELDHDPALGIRLRNEDGTDWVPHQHDTSCLVWRPKDQHARKTHGRSGESRNSSCGNGDTSRAAKVKRIIARRLETQQSAEATAGSSRGQRKYRWAKRKLQSRNTFKRKQQ